MTRTPDHELEVVLAHLPQNKQLPAREQAVLATLMHTTGRGLAKVAARSGAPGTRAYDDAALAWYRASGWSYYGTYLVGSTGVVFELAPPALRCWHAAGLKKNYTSRRHHAWWRARWPHVADPTALVGRYPNAVTIGIDLLPGLDGGFSPAQLSAAAALVRRLHIKHDLPLKRRFILGHEDVDPVRRGKRNGGWDPGRRFDWAAFIRAVQAPAVEPCA